MTTTMDEAGRVVIPADVQEQLGLAAGMELELVVEGFALRIAPAKVRPQLVRRGDRLVAQPHAVPGQLTEVDLARLIDEERERWPG